MNSKKKQIWLDHGYELFAHEGPGALKIEVLARKVSKSKSSFYHYFADLDLFISCLLDQHLARAKVIIQRERDCQTIIPELVNVMLEFKLNLLFNRQLLLNGDQQVYRECHAKTSVEIAEAIINIWSEFLELNQQKHLAMKFLKLGMDNIYLQMREGNITYEWLCQYLLFMKSLITDMKFRFSGQTLHSF